MFAQKAEFVKGKNYKSFIFPKEHPIWGFPLESSLYTPIAEAIARAEKILKDNISTDYLRGNQQQYKIQLINNK